MVTGKLLLNKNAKRILLVCAIIGVIFILEHCFIASLREQIKNFHRQIQVEEHQLKENLTLLAKKELIFVDYEYCKPYLKKVINSDKQMIGELLSEMESLVNDSGSSVVNLSPQDKPEQTDMYKKYKAEFLLEANFEQLIAFLHNIQESTLLIELEKFSITDENKNSGNVRINGIVSMAVFL